jgi:predicted negative regulator of RcsB-dependent stress response
MGGRAAPRIILPLPGSPILSANILSGLGAQLARTAGLNRLTWTLAERMATNLDLDEQEQIDQLKYFWGRYGNLITALITIAMVAYAAFAGWNWYQRDQAAKASAMYDEFEKVALAADVDRTTRVFNDLKDRYPSTAFTGQAGLMAAKIQFDKGQADNALATLTWVADNANEPQYQAVARLRLAGILMDQKKYDEALKRLDAVNDKDFAALVEDRRGDILIAQGNKEGAKTAYAKAWQTMDPSADYRRLIEAKLTALGAAPNLLPTIKPKPAGGAQ